MKNIKHIKYKKYLCAFITLILITSAFGVITTVSGAATAASTTNSSGNSTQAATLTTIQYEAESAYLTGGTKVDTSTTGYSSSGYVDGYTAVGAMTIFAVHAPSNGTYAIMEKYANASLSTKTLHILVNGIIQQQVAFPVTVNGSTWAGETTNITLRAGLNTLSYTYMSGDNGNVSLDYISISNDDGLASHGATLPYVEYEAESATTNGTIIGPDRTYLNMASEASGRKAVKLGTQGQYVEFTLTQPANAIDIRYSIPDSSDGAGLTAPLSLYVNGTYNQALTLTSKYSWVYGGYPYTNAPSNGSAHRFFDESRALLGSTLAAGTKVRLQVDASDTAAWYVIDLADFYMAPAAYAKPASGYLSVTSSPYNADPSGAVDATQAIQNAVNAAEAAGEGVWIPAGTYTVTGHITLNNVTMRGAGPWYSLLQGAGIGLFGNSSPHPSTNVQLYDFAISGQTTVRNNSSVDSGIGGSLGGSSVVQNVWIEHVKAGIWVDGPSSGLLIVGDTVRDTFADGINLHMGVSNTTVEQTQVRNTGDDGMAMWSQTDPDQNDAFVSNTVQLPMLANDFGIYGGSNNSVLSNIATDTVSTGAGVNVGNMYGSVPLSGTTTVANNLLERTGSVDRNTQLGLKEDGALWLFADDSSITGAIIVTGNEIDDSTYAAIQALGAGGNSITNVTFTNDTINTAATYAIQEETASSATFSSVTATGLGLGGQYNCGVNFTITQGSSNSGWGDVHCGSSTPPPPTPTQPGPTPSPGPTPPPGPTSTPQPIPSGSLVTAINAGGGATGNFVADTGYNQGTVYTDTSTAIDTSEVSAPAPQAIYQTVRWNSAFTYTIPGLTAGAPYTVQLDWAELTFQGTGQREFNVAINGTQVLSNFDVYAAAGYKKALAELFAATANGNGQIIIAFTQGVADNPFINGIEIWKGIHAGTQVRMVNAGGEISGNFAGDMGYDQGTAYTDTSTAINTSSVSNPAPQAVWQNCRWNSSFTYTLNGLTSGASYTLKLDWAELTFHGTGQRTFNVAINGSSTLSNFDVYATGGYKTAVQKQFTITADRNGQIIIAFTHGTADNPFISGIELYTT